MEVEWRACVLRRLPEHFGLAALQRDHGRGESVVALALAESDIQRVGALGDHGPGLAGSEVGSLVQREADAVAERAGECGMGREALHRRPEGVREVVAGGAGTGCGDYPLKGPGSGLRVAVGGPG